MCLQWPGRSIPLLLALALVPTVAVAASAPSVTDRRAVVVLVDGVPLDVLRRTETPNLDEIAAEGGLTSAYVGGTVGTDSESPTVSAVGYQSMLTGTWANKHNVWDNKVTHPDYRYWDMFRMLRHDRPEAGTAVFSTWLDNRTKLLGDGLPAAGGSKISFAADGYEHDLERFPHDDQSAYIARIDRLVAAEAARYIEAEGPVLSWVYLQYTDDIGHRFGDSPMQAAAVRQADSFVGEVWRAVQRRRASTGEDWLVVVTSDHGRDAVTGKHHGGQSERERTIWVVTNSRHRAQHWGRGVAIVDILPSVMVHLGVEIPAPIAAQLDGRSFLLDR